MLTEWLSLEVKVSIGFSGMAGFPARGGTLDSLRSKIDNQCKRKDNLFPPIDQTLVLALFAVRLHARPARLEPFELAMGDPGWLPHD